MEKKFKVGDKVKIPHTKHGAPRDKYTSVVVNQAAKRKIPFLYITAILNDTVVLNWKLNNEGDYYSVLELEHYEEHYEIY